MFGAEHDYLKTIVPISGLIGVKELMWKNGSSEARAPIMHNGVYGSYGIDGDEEDYQNLCPDYIIGSRYWRKRLHVRFGGRRHLLGGTVLPRPGARELPRERLLDSRHA